MFVVDIAMVEFLFLYRSAVHFSPFICEKLIGTYTTNMLAQLKERLGMILRVLQGLIGSCITTTSLDNVISNVFQ